MSEQPGRLPTHCTAFETSAPENKKKILPTYMKLVGDTQKYPYVVGVSADADKFGSGILLNSRFVLTCNHIGVAEEMKELYDYALLEVVTFAGLVPVSVKAADSGL